MRCRHIPVLSFALALCTLSAPPLAAQCETEQVYASDADPNDQFGHAVALTGDVLLVGAPAHAPQSAGAAYIIRRQPSGDWAPEQLLVPTGLAPSSQFGFSVAASADVCVVGAPTDPTASFDAGAAYVYRYDVGMGAWLPDATLFSFDRDPLDEFGHSVAIDDAGELITVGAWHDSDNGTKSGSVHVYRWSGSSWDHEAKLIGSDVTIEDKFGEACDVSGDVIVVGARGDDESATTGGAVYVYRNTAGVWSEETKLISSDAVNFDRLGQAVAIDGDVVVAGAYFDDDAGTSSGATFVFRRDTMTGTWSEEQKLTPAGLGPGDQLGFAVSIDGDLIAVSAPNDDDAADNTGAVYFFRHALGVWTEEAKLVPKDGGVNDSFGQSLSLDGTRFVAGASLDDDQFTNAGAAYIYEDIDLFTLIAPAGYGTPGVTGIPALSGSGPLTPGSSLTLTLHAAAPSAASFVVLGTREARIPLKGGVLLPAPDVVVGPLVTDVDGSWTLTTSMPSLPPGLRITLHAWTSDVGCPAGMSASNALRLTPPSR